MNSISSLLKHRKGVVPDRLKSVEHIRTSSCLFVLMLFILFFVGSSFENGAVLGGFNTSLDKYIQNVPNDDKIFEKPMNRDSWGPKQKRCYHRFLSGLRKAFILGKTVRFLHLTTSPYAKDFDLNADFQVLRKRINKSFGSFEYCMIRTGEGFGVLHILYVGSYIPQSWLSENWADVHGSPIVWIKQVFSCKGAARYTVSHYVVGQSFVRCSWSWGWVCKGFVHAWKRIKWRYENYGMVFILRKWDEFLYNSCYKDLILDNFFCLTSGYLI